MDGKAGGRANESDGWAGERICGKTGWRDEMDRCCFSSAEIWPFCHLSDLKL